MHTMRDQRTRRRGPSAAQGGGDDDRRCGVGVVAVEPSPNGGSECDPLLRSEGGIIFPIPSSPSPAAPPLAAKPPPRRKRRRRMTVRRWTRWDRISAAAMATAALAGCGCAAGALLSLLLSSPAEVGVGGPAGGGLRGEGGGGGGPEADVDAPGAAVGAAVGAETGGAVGGGDAPPGGDAPGGDSGDRVRSRHHHRLRSKDNYAANIAEGGETDPPRRGGAAAERGRAFRTRLEGAPPCSRLTPEEVDYTLVTQLSGDRLWMMGHHCSRWGLDNPISVVVYTDESSDRAEDEMVEAGCRRDSLTVRTLPTTSYGEHEYPVNVMRNMALREVRTSHVMYVDVDFWESRNLRSVLMSKTVTEEMAADHRLAAVVPAFQVKRQCAEYKDCREKNLAVMPNTTEEMIQLVMAHEAGAFDPTNRGGHGSTSYGAWYAQPEGDYYDVPCFKSNRYEPYLAFRYCEDLPPFQEAFTGYGKNKMTWVMQMRRVGYDFSQLGRVFVVHYPHLDSVARLEWNKGPKEMFEPVDEGNGETRRRAPGEVQDVDWRMYSRGQMDLLYVEFRDWLYREVDDEARVFLCKDAKDDDKMLWVDKEEEGEDEDEEKES